MLSVGKVLFSTKLAQMRVGCTKFVQLVGTFDTAERNPRIFCPGNRPFHQKLKLIPRLLDTSNSAPKILANRIASGAHAHAYNVFEQRLTEGPAHPLRQAQGVLLLHLLRSIQGQPRPVKFHQVVGVHTAHRIPHRIVHRDGRLGIHPQHLMRHPSAKQLVPLLVLWESSEHPLSRNHRQVRSDEAARHSFCDALALEVQRGPHAGFLHIHE